MVNTLSQSPCTVESRLVVVSRRIDEPDRFLVFYTGGSDGKNRVCFGYTNHGKAVLAPTAIWGERLLKTASLDL